MGNARWIKFMGVAALFFGGLGLGGQPVNAQVKGHLSKVQVVKKAPVWTNYKKGKKTHKYLKKGTVKKVKASATDKKHKVWLKIGNKNWIASKYTVVLTTTKQTAAKKPANPVLNTSQLTQAASFQAPVGSSWRQNAVVALAKAQVGKAYVWGATGPSSFDCSGLVQWVYKTAIGQTVSRTTYTQVEEGVAVPVSTASLQPGDLLFWGDVAAPYHVAIYVGNGQYVSAADEQQGVILATISSYFWPSTARRIL